MPIPPHPDDSRPSGPDADDAPDVTLRVTLPAAAVARLRSYAAREGASVEALAALWLEEKLAEAARNLPAPRPTAPRPPRPEAAD